VPCRYLGSGPKLAVFDTVMFPVIASQELF